MHDKRNREKAYAIIFIALVFLFVVGLSYSFFMINPDVVSHEVTINTGTLGLTLRDNDNDANKFSLYGSIKFGDIITKKLSIENSGDGDVYAEIDWHNLINTYTEGSLIYTLVEDSSGEELLKDIHVPHSASKSDLPIIKGILVSPNETKTYTMTVKFVGLDRNQTQDLSSNFYSEFDIIESSQNMNYDIKINKYNKSMFIWSGADLFNNGQADDTIEFLKKFGITDVYFCISLDGKNDVYIKKLYDNGFDVYYLTGDPSMYDKAESYTKLIDYVYNYNLSRYYKIKGVYFDVEAYLNSTYAADIPTGFETFANTLHEAYQYAKEKNIKMINATPYWLETYYTSRNFTDEEKDRCRAALDLIYASSDRVSVMNYYKTAMGPSLADEMVLAEKYNVEIESIADFNSGEAVATFHDDEKPLEYLIECWKEVFNRYDYDKLMFSYHHLDSLEAITGNYITNAFEFLNSEGRKITSGKYTVTTSSGRKIVSNIGNSILLKPDETYNIFINGNPRKLIFVSSEDVSDIKKKTVYQCDPEQVVGTRFLSIIYLYTWTGSKYDSVGLNDKQVIVKNTITGEESTHNVINNSGKYIKVYLYPDIPYELKIMDGETVITNNIDYWKRGSNIYDDQNNKIIISSDIASSEFYMSAYNSKK